MRKLVLLLTAHAFLCTLVLQAQDQDSPSLGDVARQSRAQKQQKDAQAKDATAKDPSKPSQSAAASTKPVSATKASHVITNEELPEHAGQAAATQARSTASTSPDADLSANGRQQQAEAFKSNIQGQKRVVSQLQSEISSLSASIQYAGGNCVANCVEWNERQQQKQQQVDRMKSQLEDAQHRLDEMQESARRQGFGGSVSDPE